MTGMEQNLRYIEREIRFMVKDQYGNPTYVKFADRVIEDTCGISNFCSTVLSSKRPLTVILRAVRGPRGDVIVRFFNASLHDTRIDMVLVLVEIAKLRMHNNRKSRSAYEYFTKLYRKAKKRMIRMITGSKGKESFKSMYRGLKSFAKFDDFDYDDDEDDDEIDDYFDNINEFGDSDYAQACLEAYREGKIPPEIDLSEHLRGMNTSLKGNEEILSEIAGIEAKLGRQLSDAELDKLLCGDDDEDEFEFNDISDARKSSDAMIDSIVDAIVERLGERVNGLGVKKNDYYRQESLDEFIDRETDKPSSVRVVNTPVVDISNDSSVEDLIGIHNRLKNDVPVEYAEVTVSDNTEDESDTDESGSLPPSNTLGGKHTYNEADLIDVDESDVDETEEDYPDEENQTNSESLMISDETFSTQMDHQLLVGDIIRDHELASSVESADFKKRIQVYFTSLGMDVTDIFISLVPSNTADKLFSVIATIRVTGDFEIINEMHINAVVLAHIKRLSERFGIDADLFDTEINIVDSESTFNMDLKALNTLKKDFTPQSVDNLYSALSAVSAYIYRRLDKLVDVRFVNSPENGELHLYLFSKSDELLDAEFEEFYKVELDGDGILAEIFDAFHIDYAIIYHCVTDYNEYDGFFELANTEISHQIENTPLAKRYLQSNEEFIQRQIENTKLFSIFSQSDVSVGQNSIIVDNLYRVYTNPVLDQGITNEIEFSIKETGDYSVQLENVLRAISLNVEVSNLIRFCEAAVSDEDEETEETPKTSNFGI